MSWYAVNVRSVSIGLQSGAEEIVSENPKEGEERVVVAELTYGLIFLHSQVETFFGSDRVI